MSTISFRDCRLYAIIDRWALLDRDPLWVAQAAIRGGADVVQWRDKSATDREFLQVAGGLRDLTRRLKALFIVNDRIHIAMRVQADGVHLGHEDLPVKEARSLVGGSMWIGRSTHSLAEALAAQADGADYIGVGPIFSTPTKPDYKPVGLELIRAVNPILRIPWVAIGGIDLQNLALVLSAGATRVAVVRSISGAADPQQAARTFKEKLIG